MEARSGLFGGGYLPVCVVASAVWILILAGIITQQPVRASVAFAVQSGIKTGWSERYSGYAMHKRYFKCGHPENAVRHVMLCADALSSTGRFQKLLYEPE